MLFVFEQHPGDSTRCLEDRLILEKAETKAMDGACVDIVDPRRP